MNIFAGQWSLHHPLPRPVTSKKGQGQIRFSCAQKEQEHPWMAERDSKGEKCQLERKTVKLWGESRIITQKKKSDKLGLWVFRRGEQGPSEADCSSDPRTAGIKHVFTRAPAH